MAKNKPLKKGQIKEFSEFINEPYQTVYQWYVTGKLNEFIKNKKIDFESAKNNIQNKINRKRQLGRKPKIDKPLQTAEEVKSYLDETIGDLAQLDLYELQRRNELEKLLLARIKREQLEEDLILKETVKQECFNAFRLFRDAIMNLPDRESAGLMNIKDEKEFRRRFGQILRQPLEDLQKFKYAGN
jgi:hypothetical protein